MSRCMHLLEPSHWARTLHTQQGEATIAVLVLSRTIRISKPASVRRARVNAEKAGDISFLHLHALMPPCNVKEIGMSSSRIAHLAHDVDAIDDEIVRLLAERFRRSREIGVIKRDAGQPMFDPTRVASQKERFVRACKGVGLDEPMSLGLITLILDQVITERRKRTAR